MERLSLPRRNFQANEVEKSPPKCRPDLPKDPLPTWVTLPMDAKLPMIPGPKKNVLLYTTNLGEKVLMSSPELDFDLSDPYSLTMSNYYKPLHDPHLKPHLVTSHMRKRLIQGGFITKDGKVICTLKEYNEYRQYLRKINLLLDKKHMEGKGSDVKRVGRDGDKITKAREDKAKSMRERLEKQSQEAKERYTRLMAETEERRQKFREIQLSKMSEREKQLKEEHERRQALVDQKQEEDRKKKMEMLRTWMMDDKERCDMADRRKAQRTKERQTKLSQSWDERRRLQAQRLEEEQRIKREAEIIKQRRLKEREQMVNRQRRRQQAIFERMTKKQREDRERLEAEYAKNIALRLEKRKKRARRRKLKAKKGTKVTEKKPLLRSNWDLTELLLQEYSDSETHPRSASAANEPSIIEVDKRRVVSDMQIPREISFVEPRELVTPNGIPTAARITKGLTGLLMEDKQMDSSPGASDLALALVFTNNYLASKVISPAIERYNRSSSKQKKSLRFSLTVNQVSYTPEDYEYDYDIENMGDGYSDSDDDSDDELKGDSGSGLLTAVDSLTRVHRSADQSPLAGLADILCRILDKLEKGELSQQKASKLSEVAREILLESFGGQEGGSPSETSLVIQSSSTSLVAAELVKNSMDTVQQELLKYAAENEMQDFYEWPLVSATSSELAGMSKFVAETAIAMAVESLMSCTDDILGRHGTSASDSQLHGKGRKGKDTGTMSDSKLGAARSESTESLSCTSEFIIRILKKIVDQVKEDRELYTPTQIQGKRTGPSSDTSLYIMNLLKRAVSEVQTNFAAQDLRALDNQPKSKISIFVMDTLERVVKEIQRSRSPSATSFYIDSLLSDLQKEVKKGKANLSWDKSYDLHANKDKASLTSLFIRNTLSKVLHEMEDDFPRQDVESPSVTSVFADEIVKATLKKCSSAVCQEMLPSHKLTELTAAIISSQQRKEDSSCPNIAVIEGEFLTNVAEASHSYSGIGGSQCAESVNLAESLIKTTLEKAKQSLSSGVINAQQVIQVLSQMNASAGSETAIDVDGKPIPASLCSLEQAKDFLSGSIDKTLQEIDKDLNDTTGNVTWGGEGQRNIKESDIACLVQSILEKAVRELNLGLVDESTIEKIETDIRRSLECVSVQGVPDDSPDNNTNNHTVTGSENNTATGSENNTATGPENDTNNHTTAGPENNRNNDDNSDGEDNGDDKDNEKPPDVPELTTDDEDMDEVEIHPTLHGEEIDLDPKIVGKALMAFSVKNLNQVEDLKDPLPRNSFRSLISPDVSDISGIDTSSSTNVKSDLVRASVGALPSQTKLRMKGSSLFGQGFKKATGTPSPLAGASDGKPALAKTKSLEMATPKDEKQPGSPFGSPESSPKSSKTKIKKAALVQASAPMFGSSNIGRKRSPIKFTGTSLKEVSPTSSKRTVPSRTGSDSGSPKKSPSGSSKKSSNSRSPSGSSIPIRKQSGSKVKATTSATKKSKESIIQPEVSNSTEANVDEPEPEKEPVPEETPTEPEAESETKEREEKSEEGEAETPPEVIEVSSRNSKTKKDQPLPRESGPIEMVSSTNRPSVKKSNDSDTSVKSGDNSSPPNVRRSQDFAPRPSSGFKKSSSTYSKNQRGSQGSVGGSNEGSREGSTHSLSSVTGGGGSSQDQAKKTSSDSKIQDTN